MDPDPGLTADTDPEFTITMVTSSLMTTYTVCCILYTVYCIVVTTITITYSFSITDFLFEGLIGLTIVLF